MNVCNPNPCLNQGVCVQSGSSIASCNCSANYFGFLCEYLNPCRINPCLNGGTCTPFYGNNAAQYTCTCAIGYSGTNCATNILLNNNIISVQCISTSCLNGGVCQVISNTINCICQNGFTGKLIFKFKLKMMIYILSNNRFQLSNICTNNNIRFNHLY